MNETEIENGGMGSIDMIDFKAIEIQDKQWIDPLLAAADKPGCQYSFINLFGWSIIYKYRVARVRDYLVVKGEQSNGVRYYFFPAGCGGDLETVLREMKEDAVAGGHQFVMYGLSPEETDALKWISPGAFAFNEMRNSFDYVYLLDKLVNLSGHKLQAKRNHINRFKENNKWGFEEITPGNLTECWDMNEEWCELYGCKDDKLLENEECVVRRFFRHYSGLGLEGGLLRSNGKVIAFTMGSKLNSDTYDIYVEKAFREIQGAYQTINREFAAFIQKRHPDMIYVNREDDMGQPGLRKAKLSYYPVRFEKKYAAKYLGRSGEGG